jgi:hypothetical protein
MNQRTRFIGLDAHQATVAIAVALTSLATTLNICMPSYDGSHRLVV